MKCSFCNQKPVYLRRNEGQRYCAECFSKSIEKKVRKTIHSNKLIQRGDRVAVALSGGKDSSNTLFILNKIFKTNSNVKLIAITLDEGIKGYRKKSIKKGEKLCKQLGVKQHTFSFEKELGITVDDIRKKLKFGFCGSCGLMRRYLLNKKARELGATKLATGHNLDDECQTILMNIIKGDLLRLVRMGPMPKLAGHKNFVQRIKPIVFIPENESELYAEINSIPIYPCGCVYSSDNALRGETRKFLNRLEKSSPGIKYTLVESAQKFVPDIKTKFKARKIGNCENCSEPSSQKICKVCEIMSQLS